MTSYARREKFAHADSGHGSGVVSDAAIAAGVQPEEMDTGDILGAVTTVAALVVVIVIAVFQIVNLEVQDVRLIAASEGSGTAQLKELRLAAVQKLNRYEPIANTAGKYRIPIDRAMELIESETFDRATGPVSREVVLRRE